MTKRVLLVGGGAPVDLSKLNLPPIDVTIGIDQGIETLVEANFFPISLAIGDFDSLSSKTKQKLPDLVEEVISLPAEKDVTDTEAALLVAIDRFEPDECFLTGVFGGRIDHLISNLWVVHQPRFQTIVDKITLLDETNSVRFFPPGTYRVTKELDKTYLSFIGMTSIESLTLRDVKYPLDQASYAHPMALISNEFLTDIAQFSFTKGIIAVVQSK